MVCVHINPHVDSLERVANDRLRIHRLYCSGEFILFYFFTFSPTPACHSSLSAGERGEKMEGGAVGAASENDGGKTVACRV